MSADEEIFGEEEIVSETVFEDERSIRVYGGPKGDFVIRVPAGCRVTFGYFNPASPRFDSRGGGGWQDRPNVAVQTALRIYEGPGEKSNQLACFIGVRGFRDERVKLTNLTQKVVIQTNFEDDGEGNSLFGRDTKRELVASPEPDTYT